MTASPSHSTSRSGSRGRSLRAALAVAAVAVAAPRAAYAQACCAGGSAVTPARLELHENMLAGAQIRAADVVGSFGDSGDFQRSPAGASELDLEQDLFGAIRLFDRGQVALLVPFVETQRAVQGTTERGGGIGDLNFSGRYDFFLAGQSMYVPGIAVLAGFTLPTGTPPESAKKPLATDATGVGSLQGTVGIAIEQIYGDWFFGVTALMSQRAARTVHDVHERLGSQWSALAAAAYAFDSGAALALGASYTLETSAVINGETAPLTSRRSTTLSLAGLWPVDDDWRLQGSLFANPPVSSFGRNQPTTVGLTAVVVRAFR